MPYSLVTTSVNAVRVVGAASQVTLSKQRIRRTESGYETTETYGATDIDSAKAFQTDCLNDERCSDCTIDREPPDITIDVNWAYDRTDASWGSGSPAEESWEMELFESAKPLASHPYFAAGYVAGAGITLAEKLGPVDYAIATGASPDTAGDYQVWLKRYAGLKLSGVEDWVPHGIILRRKQRVYRSLPAATWQGFFANIHRAYTTASLPARPADIDSAIAGLTFPKFPDDGSVTVTETTAAKLVWVKKAPIISPVGRNAKGPRDIIETWIGGEYISAVLYPAAADQNPAPSLYDPQST